jgi:hypothetical protein
MGPDFEIAPGAGSVRPGSPSAKGLPDGFTPTINIDAMTATDNAMPQMCKAFDEKGATFDGCTPYTLTDGQIVQANFSRWAPTAQYPQDTAGESVRVLFRQANGVLAYVDLVTSAPAAYVTDENGAAAGSWLKSMLDRMGAAVTNPNVEPEGFLQADNDPQPVPEEPAPTDGATNQAMAEKKAMAEKQAYIDKQAAGQDPAAAPMPEKEAMAQKQAMAEKQAMADKEAAAEAAAAKQAAAEGGSGK